MEKDNPLALEPPLGWNSFDSYGVYLYEEAAVANLNAMKEKLKPYGYEYFVIDAGWFGEFKLREGTIYPAEKHAKDVNINEYGLLQPSNCYFPHGLQTIIDQCHSYGLKFGLHLMRGIPREAYKRNTVIKGTNYHARDIADTTSICTWNHQNYGVDMSKPGAQEFYNSLVNQMAEWGVDYLKYDDIVPFPAEVEAVSKAIAQCGRPILLSLSPGGNVDTNAIDFFKKGNMLRVTHDIWDDQKGIDECFNAWKIWQGKEGPGFWIDMDMIPFGKLQLMSPRPKDVDENLSTNEIKEKINNGELSNIELLAGKGWTRWSKFSKDQMYTFITLRALSASPLMMGGDLPTLDDFSLELITNKDVLDCNQNGVMGKLVFENNEIEIWNAAMKNKQGGWIGIFNRSEKPQAITLNQKYLGLNAGLSYNLEDIWNNKKVDALYFTLNSNGVKFLKYSNK